MSKRCTNPKMMAHPEQCKGICEQCDDYKEWPATCPDCDDPIALHDEHGCHAEPVAGGFCECKRTPADQSEKRSVNGHIKKTPQEIRDNCSKCPEWEGFCMVTECILEQPKLQPEKHCPLREKEQIELLDLMCKGNVEGLEPVEVAKLISLWYRWYKEQKQVHDAEMRQEFVKECTKVQPDIDVPPNFKKYTDEYFIYCQGANDYWETVKVHIRAIVGKEPQ